MNKREKFKENRRQAQENFKNNPEDYEHIHGTVSGYSYYGCRCWECKRKHKEQLLSYRYKTCPEKYHGTKTGYGLYACRCHECREAMSVIANERNAKKREEKQKIKPIEMADADYPTPVAKEVEDAVDDDLIRSRLFNQIDVQHTSETHSVALTKYMDSGNPEVLPPVFKTMRKNIIEGRA